MLQLRITSSTGNNSVGIPKTFKKENMNTNKWISTDEELPLVKKGEFTYDSLSEPVLVCTGYSQLVAYLKQDSDDGTFTWVSSCSRWWRLTKVTHWMHLPDFPE